MRYATAVCGQAFLVEHPLALAMAEFNVAKKLLIQHNKLGAMPNIFSYSA
jgi:hypothetical protein